MISIQGVYYTDDFLKQKIVWGNLNLKGNYAYIEKGIYINAPSPFIVPGDLYLLGILNSKLADFYIKQLGVTRNGGYFEYKPMFVNQLPVPVNKSVKIIETVKLLLESKETLLDIDRLVCEHYGLSDEETNYITHLNVI